MNVVRRLFLATALLATGLQGNAKDLPSQCLRKEIEAHVLQQFGAYGPLSVNREYFGFIYLHDGAIGSAVTRSRVCAKAGNCRVDSNQAVRSIPRSAKVLGEWHTHPHHGSGRLSADDVRGAYNNRHISCYSAFYSTPSGAIYAWNADQISVPIAMATRAHLGNYMDSAFARTVAMRPRRLRLPPWGNSKGRTATPPCELGYGHVVQNRVLEHFSGMWGVVHSRHDRASVVILGIDELGMPPIESERQSPALIDQTAQCPSSRPSA